MLIAAYMVAGFSVAGVYAWAWLRGQRDRYHRIGLVVPFTIAALAAPAQLVVGDWAARAVADRSPPSSRRSRASGTTTDGRADPPARAGTATARSWAASRSPACCRCSPSTTRTRPSRGSTPCRPTSARRSTWCASRSRRWSAIGTALVLLAAVYLVTWWRRRRPPRSPWFYRAAVLAGPAAVVALICGWITTEVGRQPWIVYRVMRVDAGRDRRLGHPARLRDRGRRLRRAHGHARSWMLRRLARSPLDEEVAGAETLPRRRRRVSLADVVGALIVLGLTAYAVLGGRRLRRRRLGR